ncbi:MAG: hypothetical protein ACKOE6_12095 [Flammeovirgaceae bacterium]
MAKLSAIMLLLSICAGAFAQQNAVHEVDSAAADRQLQYKLDSLQKKPTPVKADTLQTRWQKKIDSLKILGNTNRYRDSLKVLSWADSLRTSVAATISRKQNSIYKQVGSLLVRNQPTAALQRKADSLSLKQQSLMTEINDKQNQLQQKLSARYKRWAGECRA